MSAPPSHPARPATATRGAVLRTGAKLGALLLLPLGAACGSAATAPPGAPADDGAAAPATLAVGTGALVVDYWPAFIAQETGIFSRHALTVEITPFETPSLAIQALATGAVDAAMVATDLAINAQERGVPLASVAGVYSKATYSLVTARTIADYGALRGKTLAVSDLKDATTLLLRKMLSGQGLKDGDYDVVPVGGSGRRAAAIAGGQAAGALLGVPVNFALEGEGYPSLGYASDALPEYLFDAVHVQRDWARANSATLVRFLQGLLEATAWLYDPAHREAAIAILAARFKTSPEIGNLTYDLTVSRLQAFPREGEISPVAFTAVLDTMAEMGLIGQPAPGAAKYVDLSYLELARKGAPR